ncbi:peptidoglycan endopeptidase [Sphingomonas sp.]|jgi:cell wall-associated NlpC family hydrolase|uniref:peptidoglycan endopeptidase n=1 Tax=Sphingomonas sp. TaxID=28214 RepID=UPI002D809EF3|nr:peptidoglycan endopeptidase [Sphingomonas sp.]HEU0043858.1 peptidoglycan endopeptidase [Sphingomonas sp.]
MSAVADAALAAVGARFRLHGRVPDTGLDCVGLAAWALRAGGFRGEVPTGYALRGGDAGAVAALLDRVLVRSDDAHAGDVLLMRTGPGQLHLGIRTDAGLVHADAGLRRVVVRPGVVPWPVLGIWRMGEG